MVGLEDAPSSISWGRIGLEDGAITSLADPLTEYLPGLTGPAYDGVTVRQLLTMTSGAAWNEDYADPSSDVAKIKTEPSEGWNLRPLGYEVTVGLVSYSLVDPFPFSSSLILPGI